MKHTHQKSDPTRLPTWRFDRAVEVMRGDGAKQFNRYHDDQYTLECGKFLRSYDATEDEHHRHKLFARNMGLFYAYDLHQDNDASDIRFVVEARILARQDDATIAGKIGTLAETITWYERLFFCVRDRLNVSDYIHRTILRRAYMSGGGAAGHDFTTKLFAYFGGARALEFALYGGFAPGDRPQSPAAVAAYFDRTMSSALRSKTAAALSNVDVNEANVAQLMAIHLRIVEIEQESRAGEPSEALKAVDTLLNTVRWVVGKQPLKGHDPLAEFDGTAVELRADEMMRLTYDKRERRKKKYDKLKALSINPQGGVTTSPPPHDPPQQDPPQQDPPQQDPLPQPAE